MNKYMHLLCNVLVKKFQFIEVAICSESAHHTAFKLAIENTGLELGKACKG